MFGVKNLGTTLTYAQWKIIKYFWAELEQVFFLSDICYHVAAVNSINSNFTRIFGINHKKCKLIKQKL
jgi:hypothetical protein